MKRCLSTKNICKWNIVTRRSRCNFELTSRMFFWLKESSTCKASDPRSLASSRMKDFCEADPALKASTKVRIRKMKRKRWGRKEEEHQLCDEFFIFTSLSTSITSHHFLLSLPQPLMQFGAFMRDEAKDRGSDALQVELSFNQKNILEVNTKSHRLLRVTIFHLQIFLVDKHIFITWSIFISF